MLFSSAIVLSEESDFKLDRKVLSEQDINLKSEEKNIEIFSASRSLKNINELPFTVYVITRDDILKNGYITLVDALKTLPTVRVSQPGGTETGETFQMLGLVGNLYSKILINNIPITPSTTNGFPIGAQLPIRQAERIEVIYGPSGAIYGADAMNGVINIITKQPEKDFFAQADVSKGDNSVSALNFIIGGKAGRDKNVVNYSVFGNLYESRDLPIIHDNNVYSPVEYFGLQPEDFEGLPEGTFEISDFMPYYEGDLERPEINKIPHLSRMIGFNISYRNLTFSYMDMYRKDHSSIGRTPYLFKFNDPGNFFGENIQNFALTYEYKKSKNLISTTNLSYLLYRLDNQTSFGLTYAFDGKSYKYAASDDIFFEQIFTYKPNDKIQITAGATYQYSGNLPQTTDLSKPFNTNDYGLFSTEKIESDDFPDGFGYYPLVFNNFGIFGQLDYQITKKLSVIGGFRFDHNSLYSSSNNPRIGLLYKLSDRAALRMNIGSAFKAPSTFYSYSSNAFRVLENRLEYAIVPNPDLKPERFDMFEIGYRFYKPNFEFNIMAFMSVLEDEISGALVPLDTTQYQFSPNYFTRQFINTEAGETASATLVTSFIWKNLFDDLKMNIRFNLALTGGTEVLPISSERIFRVRSVPTVISTLAINFMLFNNLYMNFENVAMTSWVNSNVTTRSETESFYFVNSGYYTLDISAQYRFDENISAFAVLKNATNENYGGIGATGLDVDMRYNPQMLRNIRAGISIRFE